MGSWGCLGQVTSGLVLSFRLKLNRSELTSSNQNCGNYSSNNSISCFRLVATGGGARPCLPLGLLLLLSGLAARLMARGTASGHTLAGHAHSGTRHTQTWNKHRTRHNSRTVLLLVGTLLLVSECQGVPLLVPRALEQLVSHTHTVSPLVILPSQTGQSSVLSLGRQNHLSFPLCIECIVTHCNSIPAG